MNLKIKKKNIMPTLSVVILATYSFTQLGIANLTPDLLWQSLLILSITGLLVFRFLYKPKFINDPYIYISMIMLAITLFWNNQDIIHNGILPQAYNIILYLFFWLSRDTDRWHDSFIKMMMICGLFYTAWTFICILIPGIYNSLIYPMMAPLGYLSDPKAGFTAFYGTNGLYMCIGIVSFVSYLYFNPPRKHKTIDKYIVLILIVGMLLSGKRGQFIAVVFAVLVGYYFYNSNKKHGRILKIVGILIIAVISLYIISIFIPEVTTIIERFQEQSQKGDVSSGRFIMWGRAWLLFLQKPFFGHGWRYFRYSSFTLVDYDVHNVFLQLLVEVGIVGAIPYFAFIFGNFASSLKLLIYLRKHNENNYENLYVSLSVIYEVFFIALCATGTALYQVEYMFPYFACCGIIAFYKKKIFSRKG